MGLWAKIRNYVTMQQGGPCDPIPAPSRYGLISRVLAVVLIVFWVFSLGAVQSTINTSDVYRIMDRFFSLHIENREWSPTLVRRCLKVYIEQFDPEKTYLLEQEVLPFLQMNDESALAMIRRIKNDDLSDFVTINKVIQGSIVRAQKMRGLLGEQFLSSTRDTVSSGIQSRYARTAEELSERCKQRIARFYLFHQMRSDLSSPQRKKLLMTLFDKKMRRMESNYLFLKADGTNMEPKWVEHQMSVRILKSFAKSLDTHSSFFSPEEAHEMRLSLEKQFEGVGIVLFEGVDGVMISDVVKGSPADINGRIHQNDILTEIDGITVENLPFEDVLELLKQDGHKEVMLGFRRVDGRNQATAFHVSLPRRPIVMNDSRLTTSWERFGNGIIGKISLYSFYESGDGLSSERDIKEAIRSFEKVGSLQGLVLDLRDNSGGFLNQAVKVAGLFLSNGVVVVSKYGRGDVHYLRNIVGRSFFNGPLVILTSKMSASASEIVAQALQDYGVGIVVGDERTFGKGSIQYQTVTDENAEIFFKVTVGKYYTASGRTTQIEGVKADIVVPTNYAPYNIGERYLEYPLQPDRLEPVFVDPLDDLDMHTKRLFQSKYMPYLQRVVTFWKKMVPTLRKNSEQRLSQSAQFQRFLKSQEEIRVRSESLPPNAVDEIVTTPADLQMIEAVHIVQDMIHLEGQSRTALEHAELQPTGSD